MATEGIVRAVADGGCVSELVASNVGAGRDNFDLATLNDMPMTQKTKNATTAYHENSRHTAFQSYQMVLLSHAASLLLFAARHTSQFHGIDDCARRPLLPAAVLSPF